MTEKINENTKTKSHILESKLTKDNQGEPEITSSKVTLLLSNAEMLKYNHIYE